jgi:hypothetical protein
MFFSVYFENFYMLYVIELAIHWVFACFYCRESSHSCSPIVYNQRVPKRPKCEYFYPHLTQLIRNQSGHWIIHQFGGIQIAASKRTKVQKCLKFARHLKFPWLLLYSQFTGPAFDLSSCREWSVCKLSFVFGDFWGLVGANRIEARRIV